MRTVNPSPQGARTALSALLALRILGGRLLRLIPAMVPVVVRYCLRDIFIGKLSGAAKMQHIFTH